MLEFLRRKSPPEKEANEPDLTSIRAKAEQYMEDNPNAQGIAKYTINPSRAAINNELFTGRADLTSEAAAGRALDPDQNQDRKKAA